MPTKNFLLPEEKKYLQDALRNENRPKVRERILIFLLENDGKNYEQIGDFCLLFSSDSSLLGCTWKSKRYRKFTR